MRTTVITLLCLLLSLSVQAQEDFSAMMQNASPEELADQSTTQMYTQLGLTEEQATQVYPIQLAFFTELQATKDITSRRDKLMAMKAASDKRDKELEAVLNEEQYGKYKAIQMQRREQMRQRMQQNGGRGGRGN